ncbi:hypothetical protein TIFTF001_001549 [Ficus carica]|uniref:Uncharacterized protein n=1 Tax=Ficus carica TaxID=3494 RepID=A0AA87Z7W3_FICCA|nr:hypothetical protein TIFTF001_001549 [Ficus carica]
MSKKDTKRGIQEARSGLQCTKYPLQRAKTRELDFAGFSLPLPCFRSAAAHKKPTAVRLLKPSHQIVRCSPHFIRCSAGTCG